MDCAARVKSASQARSNSDRVFALPCGTLYRVCPNACANDDPPMCWRWCSVALFLQTLDPIRNLRRDFALNA
jgi:hypothetical protein